MLSYDDAYQLLTRYGAQEPWVRHCVAVSRVARGVADRLEGRGLDSRLLVVGALLHDIGRYKTQDAVLHGVEGYRLLTDLGHHQEAFICASHVLCGMPRQEAVRYGLPDQDFCPQSLEERLVPLIDGVVEFDRPTTMEERFASISKRYSNNPAFLSRFEQAAAVARASLRSFQTDFGISLEQVAAEALNHRDCKPAMK